MTEQGMYLYGVARASAAPALQAELEAIEGPFPVGLEAESGLLALCRSLDVDELECRLADSTGGEDWLEETARNHAEVLERALVAGALVPFRLATLVRGDDAVSALLKGRSAELEEQLDWVENAWEWGVRGCVEPKRFAAALIDGDSALAALQLEAASGAGRAYFARMQFDRRLAELVRSRAEELADCLHERLAAVAREAVANPPRTGATFLNGAYLVERGRERELEATLCELALEVAPLGATLELTGPWPAYNFTGLAAPAGVA